MRLPALRRPTPSFFVSVLALLVASGGTSYAVATIGSADVRDGSLRSVDVRNGSLLSRDIADGTIRRGDLAPGAAAGQRGPAGARGPEGAQGPAGVSRWALVGTDGQIIEQSGGFTVVAGYPVEPAAANGNVYINAGEDLADNGIIATLTLQNTQDVNGDTVMNGRALGPDANPEFSGEVTVSRCNFVENTGAPIPTNCAPMAARNAQSFVVSPRNSDGSVTADGARKAFYVILTGSSPSDS